MIIDDTSHIDHAMTPYQRRYAIAQIREGKARIIVGEFGPAFYIAQVDLPSDLGTVPCALRGPIMGDAPVSEAEVTYGRRGERPNMSRLTSLPATKADVLTAIVVGDKLATIYGGPLAPKETSDPYLRDDERAASEAFWAEHALSQ